MRKVYFAPLFAVAAIGIFGNMARADDLSNVQIGKTETPPKIDGVLNDVCWENATRLDAFRVIDEDKAPTSHEAVITSDGQWLYVAYRIRQPEIDRTATRYGGKHDDFVQRDDCVKISFDPDASGNVWYHFKINRANWRQESRFLNGKMETLEWNIPWRSAVREDKDEWTAEMALPLALLSPTGDLKNARGNILFTCYIPERDPQGVAVSAPKQTRYSLAPVKTDFNEREKLVPFKGLQIAGTPFLPRVEAVSLGKLTRQGDGLVCPVTATIKNYGPTPGQGRVAVAPDSAPVSPGERVALDTGVAEKTVSFSVPAALFSHGPVYVRMIGDDDEILQRVAFNETELAATDVLSVYLDRNYYTTEAAAIAVCSVNIPDKERYFLRISDAEKSIDVRRALAEIPNGACAVPIAALSPGIFNLSVALEDAAGKTLGACPAVLIKRPPNPGKEWKIDRTRRTVLDNGKPFFAFAAIAHDRPDKTALKRFADLGFNAVMVWKAIDPATEVDTLCRDAAEQGLYVIPAIDDMCFQPTALESLKAFSNVGYRNFTDLKCLLVLNAKLKTLPIPSKNRIFDELFEKLKSRIALGVDRFKTHENLLGYYYFDEPVIPRFDQWITGKKMYDLVNGNDGYHPTMVTYSSNIPEDKNALGWFDILMTDPYWIVAGMNWQKSRNNPNYVSWITWKTVRRASEYRNPTWIVPMAAYWSATYKRIPTAAEQRCQTWLAIIHGATGLMYFTGYQIYAEDTVQAFKGLSREIRAMTPALLGAVPEQAITYKNDVAGKTEEIVYDPEKRLFPDIQATLRRYPDGDYLLIAANSRHYPVDAAITVNGLAGATRLFAEGPAPAFAYRFPPFGTAAWRLKLTPEAAKAPVRIELSLRAPTPLPPEETSFFRGARTGKKNLTVNPSFEEETVKGIPDYFFYEFKGAPLANSGDAMVWGTVRKNAKLGEKALRLKMPSTSNGYVGRVKWYCAPEHDKASDYTLSLWLKGDRDKLEVQLRCIGFVGAKTKNVMVGKEWTRYSFTGRLPDAVDRYNWLDVILKNEGTLWLDGVQFEKGDKATDFEP